MSRYLDEIYCSAVRDFGSHGTWEPSMWLWPGATGLFRRGIFERQGFLDPKDWGYQVVPSGLSSPQLIQTEGIRDAHGSVKVSAKDPLDALSASVGLSYEVEGANEVLVLTHPGRWWEVDDIEGLLERVRAVLGDWPLTKTVICAVFETPGGVVGISSRTTTGFKVNLGAGGRPHIAVVAKGGGEAELTSERSVQRVFPLEPMGDSGEHGAEQRGSGRYTPFFTKGYRVSKPLLERFGHKRLVTLDGDPVPGRIARTEPEDLVYDPTSAEMSIDEAKAMPIDELFEEVTPQILSEEVEAELDTEVFNEQIRLNLSPHLLMRAGVKSIDSVSVPRRYRRHIKEIRRAAPAVEEKGTVKS